MRLGIVRLYTGESGKVGYYNIQELGLAKELSIKLGIEVIVFILRDNKKHPNSEIINISDKVKLVYLSVSKLGNHGLLNPNILKQFNLHMIQLNADNQIGCYRVIKWCIKNKIPMYTYIGTVESDSNNKVKNIISKLIFIRNRKMMNKIANVVKTPNVVNKLKNLNVKNVRLIPVGLDVENFSTLNKDSIDYEGLYDKYNLPVNKNILLFVGRLEEYKKPLEVLDLLSYIKLNSDNYHLLIVGEGSLKEELRCKAKVLDINDNITYIEKIENKYMYEIYSISDIFINTNDKEIYGMSILESMYCGCPVIAKRAPGPEYIVSNGKSGYIIDNYDGSEWYEKIKIIISEKEKFNQNCKSRICNNFTWEVICYKYDKLFKDIKN